MWQCFTGGVPSGIWTTIWCCSACVIVGAAVQTGKTASSSRFKTGIKIGFSAMKHWTVSCCFTSAESRPWGTNTIHVITDCGLARLCYSCIAGMHSVLTRRAELNLQALQKFRTAENPTWVVLEWKVTGLIHLFSFYQAETPYILHTGCRALLHLCLISRTG